MSKVDFYGIAALREDFRNPKEKRYFLVLSGSLKSVDMLMPSKLEDFRVEISQSTYEEYKKQLTDSKAEVPLLRFSGNLELKVAAACIN